MSPRHRRPRWHDRPRGWLRAALDRLSGREKEEQPLTDDHGNHIGGDLPPVRRWPQPERPVIRTAEVDGVHLPLSDDQPYSPARMPCWSRQDMPWEVMPVGSRNERQRTIQGLVNMPRPETGTGALRQVRERGPGRLSAFASPFGAPGRIPWTPRPPAPSARDIVWCRLGMRGRITLLAGT